MHKKSFWREGNYFWKEWLPKEGDLGICWCKGDHWYSLRRQLVCLTVSRYSCVSQSSCMILPFKMGFAYSFLCCCFSRVVSISHTHTHIKFTWLNLLFPFSSLPFITPVYVPPDKSIFSDRKILCLANVPCEYTKNPVDPSKPLFQNRK